MRNILISIIATFLVVGTVGAVTLNIPELRALLNQEEELGGVTVGNEYTGVTLTPTSVIGDVITNHMSTLGSVVITGATGAALNLYNATTTNVNLRTGQVATSSLEKLASFTVDQPVGTYTFDINALIGIVYEWDGTPATSTIIYR